MEYIKRAIVNHYGSQAKFAAILGLDGSTISRVLSGAYIGDKKAIMQRIYAQLKTDEVELASIISNDSYESLHKRIAGILNTLETAHRHIPNQDVQGMINVAIREIKEVQGVLNGTT